MSRDFLFCVKGSLAAVWKEGAFSAGSRGGDELRHQNAEKRSRGSRIRPQAPRAALDPPAATLPRETVAPDLQILAKEARRKDQKRRYGESAGGSNP